MKKYLILILLAISPLARGEELPDLGDVSQASLSPQQERQIGEQGMYQFRADSSYLDDAEIVDYLNQLGYRLISSSSDPGQEFEFFALNNNAINAFAMPGGFIGVNTGLILAAQSESELASVLSHEIAHVSQHHIARMIAGQKFDTVAAMAAIAVAILAARSNPDAAQAAVVGVQAGAIQRQLNFTRIHEQEADRIGLATLQKAGFDTRAAPLFLERLQKATRLLDDGAPSYLRTHPLTTDRIADMANRVQQVPFKLVADSLSFHLVRAKLKATHSPPREAIAYFSDALGKQKHGNPVAQRYGLALALLRNNQTARAAREFSSLARMTAQNPMIASLAGHIRRADKNDKGIMAFYRTATRNFPQHRALAYDYAELLLQDRQYDLALKLLGENITDFPNDPRLYELQARAYSSLKNPQKSHHALAYHYSLRGHLSAAIEQLELARQAGTDFYELSTIDSELKKFREIAAAQAKKN